MTDALIIGYNDPDFPAYVESLRGMGAGSGAFKDLDLAMLEYEGRPYRALDLVSRFRSQGPGGAQAPFHNCDFLWPTITYLGSYLTRHGFTFDYVNQFQFEKDALREKLLRNDIRTIAITTTLYVTPQPIVEIAGFIRRYNTTARIVVGGPFVGNQVATRDAATVQSLFKYVGADFYVDSNEGEAAYVNLLKALRDGTGFDHIDNLAYRAGDSFVLTKRVPESNPLAETPIDYGLFPGAVGQFVSLRTAKSCPFTCAFCGFPKRAGAYTYLSLADVERELDAIAALGTVTTLTFLDDTFNVPKGRFKDILRMMTRRKYPFKWNAFYRSDHGDEEAITLMAESGCEGVFLGVESGSDALLAKMNKTARRKDYLKSIPLLQQSGISCYASLIVGYPGETDETVQDTIDLIEEAQPDYYRAQLWYADPLTPVWEHRAELGIRGEAFNWSHNTMDCETACDHIDRMLLTVQGSVWMPQNGFEQWSTFYLQRRGMSCDQVKAFVVAFNDGVKEKVLFPEKRGASPEVIARIRASCEWDGGGQAPAQLRMDSAFPPAAYRAAEMFFLSEVCAGSPRSNLDGIVTRDAPGSGPECRVDAGVVDGSPHDVLAAFAVLLSRIDGREDTLIVVGDLPIRLHPRADATFDELVRDVAARLAAAAPHAKYGLHFLRNEPRLRRHGLSPPALDAGLSMNGETPAVRPSLILHLEGGSGHYALTFRYLDDRLSRVAVESLAAYFLALWPDLSSRRARPIGDAGPGGIAANRATGPAADDFNF